MCSTEFTEVPGNEGINERISKEQYYLNIAHEVGKRGTCLRRNFGAVIVKEDQIISTGYSGAPRKTKNCIDVRMCLRKELNVPQGQQYELCRGVHAEQNAIIHASRLEMIGSTLFLVGINSKKELIDAKLCMLCKRMVINAGIKEVVIQSKDKTIERTSVRKWIDTNLGEFRENGGKFIPELPPDYET